MTYIDRQKIHKEIENLRGGRTLICLLNFDRISEPPMPGLSTQFTADLKEALFRVIKESAPKQGIDLCLYTRGGDTNSVWPIVSLLREFDSEFEVLVPFRCHSSGTLLALGGRHILMGPLSELSPIDPTTGNQFNPLDPVERNQRLGISVEDVRAYKSFVLEQFRDADKNDTLPIETLAERHLQPFIERLVNEVHPLALGNVQRVVFQIEQLAEKLLMLNTTSKKGAGVKETAKALTTKFYSHLHMINRHEAKEILGGRIKFMPSRLSSTLDKLLRSYEDSFKLRDTFYLSSKIQDAQESGVRFIGGVIESKARSYLYETKAVIRQYVKIPPNIQLQIPEGQPMPLIPGLPRELQVQITAQGWMHNTEPLGVTT